MNCAEFDETLQDALDERRTVLPPEAARHLEQCAECRRLFAGHRLLLQATSRWSETPVTLAGKQPVLPSRTGPFDLFKWVAPLALVCLVAFVPMSAPRSTAWLSRDVWAALAWSVRPVARSLILEDRPGLSAAPEFEPLVNVARPPVDPRPSIAPPTPRAEPSPVPKARLTPALPGWSTVDTISALGPRQLNPGASLKSWEGVHRRLEPFTTEVGEAYHFLRDNLPLKARRVTQPEHPTT